MQLMDIEDVKRLNRQAGRFFFSPDTMRFFRSRVAQTAYGNDDGSRAWFVTSEQFKGSDGRCAARAYTVRSIDLRTGDVNNNHAGFGKYASSSGATREAKRLASQPVHEGSAA